jgi:predicted MFS family arabinose efflux permease
VVVVTNLLTALSDNYALTLVLRFVAGLGTALIWPLLGGYAARLAPEGQQGRAIALAGTPIGLALGIPLGTWLSSLGGWQFAFYASAVVSLMTDQTGWVLFAFGVTSVLSVLVVGTHIDLHLRKLVVGSTLVFAACVLVLAVFTQTPVLVYAAVAAWGFAFGSSPSLFVGAVINAAGEASDVAQSITITVFSASIAVGGLIGGLLLAGLCTASITWAALILLIVAAATAVAGKKHAFPKTV